MTLSKKQINLLINKIQSDYNSWSRAIKSHKSYNIEDGHYKKTVRDSLLLERATHKSFAFIDNFCTVEQALSSDQESVNNAIETFHREVYDYRHHDNSEQQWRLKTFGRVDFSKNELISMAYDELNENAGWWNPADADSDEEAKDYQQNLDDIRKTESLLDQGKLEDPYGSIDAAYDDYHEYLSNSEDDEFDGGAKGKRNALNKLNALCQAVG